MRTSTLIFAAAFTVAGSASTLAQSPAPSATSSSGTMGKVDDAGAALAEKGAPGTVVPATPGVGVAPGIQAPVLTPTKEAEKPGGNVDSAKPK